MKLADALASEDLRALSHIDRYAERERYAAAMAAELAGRSFAEVAACFDRHGIWFARVQSYDELARDPQARHLGVFLETPINGETARLVTHPLRYDGEAPELRTMPLEIGGDSRQILAECGYSNAEIDRLVAARVIGTPPDADAQSPESGAVS